MVKVIVFALVAGVLVAGAHAQTENVKVGGIANVQVGPDGKTTVAAAGTNVNVDPNKDGKAMNGAAADDKKNGSVAVNVNAGGAVKTTVDVKQTPEKSTTGTAAATSSTAAAKPEKTTAAKPVDVKAGSTGTKGSTGAASTSTGTTTVATNPGKTTVATSSSGNTQVNTPGAVVTVDKTKSGQPTTTVNTVDGINVTNGPGYTTMSGIPYLGSLTTAGRRMLRA